MQKKKQKRSNRKAKRLQNIKRKDTNVLRSTAPAAQSGFRRIYTRFGTGIRDGNLKVETCFPMYQIQGPVTVASATTFASLRSTSGTLVNSYAMLSSTGGAFTTATSGDQSFPYISTILPLLGASFTSYKITKLRFMYEPQAPTGDSDRLVFAYASDPMHPLIQQNTNATSSTAKLLNLSDSIAFSPFAAWELDVSKSLPKQSFYTYQPPSTLTSGAEDNRFNYFGAIGCCGSVAAANNPTIHGILYTEIHVEFMEFCPIIDDFVPQLLKYQRNSIMGGDKNEKFLKLSEAILDKEKESCTSERKTCEKSCSKSSDVCLCKHEW